MAFSSETKETLANLFRHQLLHVGRSRQRRQSGLKSRRSQIRVKEFPFSRQISDEFQNFKFGVFQAKKSDDFFEKFPFTQTKCAIFTVTTGQIHHSSQNSSLSNILTCAL